MVGIGWIVIPAAWKVLEVCAREMIPRSARDEDYLSGKSDCDEQDLPIRHNTIRSIARIMDS